MSHGQSIPFSLSWTKSLSIHSLSSAWTRSLSASRSAPKSPFTHHRTDTTIITGVTEESPTQIIESELVLDHFQPAVPTSHVTASHMLLILMTLNLFNLSGCSLWYLSLSLTVASVNNTIYQSGCVFVLLFSYFLLNERLTFQKCFACIVAVGGVLMTMQSVPSDGAVSTSVTGIIFVLAASALFAAWEVGFKFVSHKYLRADQQLSDTLLFQSGIGLVNLLLFWPFLVLLHYTAIEPFQLPSNREQVISVLLPCLMDSTFTAALLCGITLCGAMFMAMGMILVVPVTFFADIIVFKKQSADIINIYSVLGAAFIIFAFVLLQKGHSEGHHDEKGRFEKLKNEKNRRSEC